MRSLAAAVLAVACLGPAAGYSTVMPRPAAFSSHAPHRCISMALKKPPRAVFLANSASKWLVVLANIVAVWSRRDFIAPFIVVGSILASFGTDVLKKAINQDRPAGAPFTDPGMPSSHALVSTFLAVGWAAAAASTASRAALLSAALLISVLRVACGYHTYAQIAVGGLVGGLTASGWMVLGSAIVAQQGAQRTAFVAAWAAYLGGSALFIAQKMVEWTGKDRDL